MPVWVIIILVLSCVMCAAAALWFFRTGKRNSQVEEENKLLEERNKELKMEQEKQEEELINLKLERQKADEILTKAHEAIGQQFTRKEELERQEKLLQSKIESHEQELARTKNIVNSYQNDLEENAKKSFEKFCEALEINYQQAEHEHQYNIELLRNSYEKEQAHILTELEEEKETLSKVRETRAAAIQAQLREKEIKDKLSFYCLQVAQSDLSDIQILENIKPKLNNPRILSMLIWSTYFQKPMTTLCNSILGLKPVCGIYKITNQLSNMCYIGQSVDLATRWKSHAKCGLGIDTPQGNKLYAAMIADGLWNFSFELLEECPRDQLNEKEKYYIELYQAKEFGYNSSGGNKT